MDPLLKKLENLSDKPVKAKAAKKKEKFPEDCALAWMALEELEEPLQEFLYKKMFLISLP